MSTHPGLFIMIDGIAGSGKTTVIQAMYEHLQKSERTCFRLHDWIGTDPPRFEDVGNVDVLFTYEPTRQWAGAMLRYEMFSANPEYSGISHAHAFALDREVMYRRLIIPALEAGKVVIQDRGVSTSLVYQPLMRNGLTIEEVWKLPGNQLAFAHAPDALVLTKIPIELVAERIQQRDDEKKGVYANMELLRQANAEFRSEWFQTLFLSRNTHLHDLDTSGELEQSKANAVQLIDELTHEFF